MATGTNVKTFFNFLQIFRGIAALMVVFHHQWVAFEQFFNVDSFYLNFISHLGKNGVDFFFVLSGFIITYSNYDKAGRKVEIKPFLINRILRIYLPFLPVSILMLLLYNLFPSVSESNRNISLLTSLTLIPDGRPALSVAWTLIHEMIFYLFFLNWFISKRLWYCFVIFWIAIIIYLNYFSIDTYWHDKPFLKYFCSFYNLEFLIGFLCASFLKKMRIPNNLWLLIFGICTGVFAILLKWNNIHLFPSSINLLFSISFAFLILGSLYTRLNAVHSRSLFMVIGNASYSIYLIHNPQISVLVRSFLRLPFDLPIVVIFLLVFISCCFLGVSYSKFFEEYMLRKLKCKLLHNPNKKTTILEVAFSSSKQS